MGCMQLVNLLPGLQGSPKGSTAVPIIIRHWVTGNQGYKGELEVYPFWQEDSIRTVVSVYSSGRKSNCTLQKLAAVEGVSWQGKVCR